MQIIPRLTSLLLVISILFSFSSCQEVKDPNHVKIAISKGKGSVGYERYAKWLKRADSTVICHDMYFTSLDSALMIFDQCDALLISGGPDVYPAIYGKINDTSRHDQPDHRRDSLEILLIRKALKEKKPILGICRGAQILNVALGGSLIIDIPTDFDTIVAHRCPDPDTCLHTIYIDEGSLLNRISGNSVENVNSNHHQAVDKLADELQIIAMTADSLPEAIQWKEPGDKSFLLGVQWHPEKMYKTDSLSIRMASFFIQEAKKFQRNKRKDK